MPTSDGIITTADICNQAVVESKLRDASVVSVKLAADLQSDTWDGTTVAAEDATAGWRIERNTGNIGLGAAYVRGALTAATIAADDITAGTLAAGVIYGGTITTDQLRVGNFDNLARDPGFERNDTTLFSYGGSITPDTAGWSIATTSPRSGGYHAEYDATNMSGKGSQRIYMHYSASALEGNPEAFEGDEFYAECWVRSGTGTPNQMTVGVVFWDENAGYVGEANSSATTPTATYQKLSVTGTAPAGSAVAVINVKVNDDGNTGTHRIDDVYFRRKVDGSIVVAGSIGTTEITGGSITTTQISATAGITGGQIATTTITGGNIATNTITATQIDSNTITASEIAAGTITTNEIDSNTITAGNIATGTLTSASGVFGTISANDVTTGTLNAANVTISNAGSINNLNASNITTGTLSGDYISGGTIDGTTIKTNGSGRRVELQSTGDQIEIFSASASVGTINETSGNLTIDSPGQVSIYGGASNYGYISASGTECHVDAGTTQLLVRGQSAPSGANSIQLRPAATEALTAYSDRIEAKVEIRAKTGTSEGYVFDGDTGTGMAQVSANTLQLKTASNVRVTIANTSVSMASGVDLDMNNNTITEADVIKAYNGSAGAPSHSFVNSTTAGMYWSGSAVNISVSSTDQMSIGGSVTTHANTNNPSASSTYNLGGTSNRWSTIYLNNSPDVSSDLTLKKQVRALPFDPVAFVNHVQPIMFKWRKAGRSGGVRDHAGFDISTLETALEEFGDFGAYTNPDYDPTPDNPAGGWKGIRTGELVPVLWAAVQQLQERVRTLEATT